MPADHNLDVYEFGRRLLEIKDIDPVYVVLRQADLDADHLRRWLLAYWCFYHVGTASRIAEGNGYWDRMRAAAGSKEYPRSSERRHFRGGQAAASVAWLEAQGGEALFGEFDRAAYEGRTLEAAEVVEYVQTWKGFGPWISFKVADMLDRLGMVKVRFDRDTAMYQSPRDGAELVWDLYHGPAESTPDERLDWSLQYLKDGLGSYDAPPRYERKVDFPEWETIFCKFKSYRGGHYHVGEDVAAVRAGLLRFARVRTCQRLLRAGRDGGLWER